MTAKRELLKQPERTGVGFREIPEPTDSIAIKPPENGIETPIDELGTICENGPIEPT